MRSANRTFSLSSVAGVSLAALLATSAQAALTISTDATSNVSCSAGVCSATAADAVLNVGDLTNLLASSPLTIQSGSLAQDILVEAPFSWTSINALTLDSFRAITVDKPVSDAGPAALNITFNDGGTGGELLFRYKGRISFTRTKSALVINGHGFKLVRNIASLASAIAKNPSGFYALAGNYNATKDGTYSATPITTVFTGTFEGLGNTISNLSIDCKRAKHAVPVGLFNYIYPSGAVKSLRLTQISYIDNAKRSEVAGGVAGGSLGYLFDDHVDGTITANVAAGGLTGASNGTISNSSAGVDIVSTAPFTGGVTSGGLVAVNVNGGLIASSYATGNVKAAAAGGLVGDNDEAQVTNSYSTGRVKGGSTNWVGGFGGINQQGGKITASYSTGKVTASSLFGGFGGAIGADGMSNNYWDTQTSGTSNGVDSGNVAGITGLTSDQFKSGLPAGFDPSVWAQNKKINNGYPYLIANPPPK